MKNIVYLILALIFFIAASVALTLIIVDVVKTKRCKILSVTGMILSLVVIILCIYVRYLNTLNTILKPTVETAYATDITKTTALLGGRVTDDGGATVTEIGICWSTKPNPTINNSYMNCGNKMSFTINNTNLNENTTYYIRAYAINEVGISYGVERTFTTETGGTVGHEYVDLGLPSGLLWATCNIGAKSPEEIGNFFAWGETTIKRYYESGTYKLKTYLGNYDLYGVLSKYNTNSHDATFDNKTTLELMDDAANAGWHGDWRMPTEKDFIELQENCRCVWTVKGERKGCLVIGRNGNSIFLPAGGMKSNDRIYNDNECGDYWSSTLDAGYEHRAKILTIYEGIFGLSHVGITGETRWEGLTVRAVCPKP